VVCKITECNLVRKAGQIYNLTFIVISCKYFPHHFIKTAATDNLAYGNIKMNGKMIQAMSGLTSIYKDQRLYCIKQKGSPGNEE
jgi:hypothetical protein